MSEEEFEKKERGDLADPKKVGRKALMDRIRSRQEQEDIAFILSSSQGRRFYWRMMEMCSMFEENFTGNNTTFYNLGMVRIGRNLWHDLTVHHVDAYFQMLKERSYDEAKKET